MCYLNMWAISYSLCDILQKMKILMNKLFIAFYTFCFSFSPSHRNLSLFIKTILSEVTVAWFSSLIQRSFDHQIWGQPASVALHQLALEACLAFLGFCDRVLCWETPSVGNVSPAPSHSPFPMLSFKALKGVVLLRCIPTAICTMSEQLSGFN